MSPDRRQRIPIPYTSPWPDEGHRAKAAAGLCFRLVCPNIAHHGWRNTGVPGARYCLACVRLLNEGTPGLCVPDPHPAPGPNTENA